METINFDIFCNIIKISDVLSIRNLILSSKNIYNTYKYNNICIDNIISRKILIAFDVPIYGLEYSKNINIQLNNILNNCSISDPIEEIILYLVNKNDNSSNTLIRHLLNISNKSIQCRSNYNTKYILSYECIEYLLLVCDDDTTFFILKTFKIQIFILRKVLSNLIFDDLSIKVKMIIDYILKQQHNKVVLHEIGNTSLTMLLIELIQYDKKNIITYFFSEKIKYNIYINYTKLINCAIQQDEIYILELLYKYNKDNIIIHPISLELLCEYGKFDTLPFILNILIGDLINANRYIKAIGNGLNTFFHKNEGKLELQLYLKEFVNTENIQKIYDLIDDKFKNYLTIY